MDRLPGGILSRGGARRGFGCAAALASLDLFDREQTIATLPPKIAALRARLTEKVSPLPHVFEIRQKGLMVGIDLRRARSQPYAPQDAIGARVCRIVRRHGVILRPLGSVVVLMPPLSITSDQIDHLVDATAAAIAEATSEPLLARPPASPTSSQTSATPAPLRGIFLLGTDTGVGKTTVGVGLLALARTRGLAPVPFKPVETGAVPEPADAIRLRSAAARDALALEIICPYSFSPPVAPALAAEQASTPLTLAGLLSAARRAAAHGDFLLVESAGGVLSPYSQDLTSADLAAAHHILCVFSHAVAIDVLKQFHAHRAIAGRHWPTPRPVGPEPDDPAAVPAPAATRGRPTAGP